MGNANFICYSYKDNLTPGAVETTNETTFNTIEVLIPLKKEEIILARIIIHWVTFIVQIVDITFLSQLNTINVKINRKVNLMSF